MQSQVDDVVVLQGVLFEGEDIHQMVLESVNPLSQNEQSTGIAGASLSIAGAGQTVTLVESEDESGLYIGPSGMLTTFSGQTYTIEAVVDGEVIASEVTMPTPIQFTDIGETTIQINELSPGEQVFDLAWVEAEGYEYVFVLQDPEGTPEVIGFDNPGGNFDLVHGLPTEKTFLNIYASDFAYYGEHELEIIKVDSAFADVFRYAPGISHSVFSGPDNVDGGTGYVAAVSSVKITLTVEEE